MSHLVLEGLGKSYGAVTAVEGLDLAVERGEFVSLLGPSGCGKTTTLQMIAGFVPVDRGRILLDGGDLAAVAPNRRGLGIVFQSYALFPHMTVAENIAFGLEMRGIAKAEREQRTLEAMALVGLKGFAERYPRRMSGGQQQRVALARALVYDPPVLLMDEPLSALDKKLREEIQFEIRRIHQETGVTILYVTHDQEEALRLSDRIAVFSQGEIDQIGTGPELYSDPATRFVAGFIGDSNFIDADVVASNAGKAQLSLPGGVMVEMPAISVMPSDSCTCSPVTRSKRAASSGASTAAPVRQ